MKCPVCNGSGDLDEPIIPNVTPYQEILDRVTANEAIAKGLQKKGYSVRQIMRHMGYKHPGSIQYLLKKHKRKKNKTSR